MRFDARRRAIVRADSAYDGRAPTLDPQKMHTRFIQRDSSLGSRARGRQLLWKLAGRKPAGGQLVIAGAGMGATLRIASETVAYTLTDGATFGQLSSRLTFVIVFEGGERLLNTYAIVVDPGGGKARNAQLFTDWLANGNWREMIARYRVGGRIAAFDVWPMDRGRSHPHDLPF